jgi:hypothetical protein
MPSKKAKEGHEPMCATLFSYSQGVLFPTDGGERRGENIKV